jgi:glycerophosphoryl diester phosphodiesterase
MPAVFASLRTYTDLATASGLEEISKYTQAVGIHKNLLVSVPEPTSAFPILSFGGVVTLFAALKRKRHSSSAVIQQKLQVNKAMT